MSDSGCESIEDLCFFEMNFERFVPLRNHVRRHGSVIVQWIRLTDLQSEGRQVPLQARIIEFFLSRRQPKVPAFDRKPNNEHGGFFENEACSCCCLFLLIFCLSRAVISAADTNRTGGPAHISTIQIYMRRPLEK